MKRLLAVAVAMILAIFTLQGCTGTGVEDSSTSPELSDSNQTVTEQADVTFQVMFPESTGAQAALISRYTEDITITWGNKNTGNTGDVTLLNDGSGLVSTTVPLETGPTAFLAKARHFDGGAMEIVATKGVIKPGSNTVVLTFVTGDWTFKNSSNVDTPLTLADSTQLSGFSLKPDYDPEMSVWDMFNYGDGWIWYNGAVLDQSGTPILGIMGETLALFQNSLTVTGFWGDIGDFSMEMDGPPPAGTHWMAILDPFDINDPDFKIFDSTNVDRTADFAPYFDTRFTDGITLVGHILEFDVVDPEANLQTTPVNDYLIANFGISGGCGAFYDLTEDDMGMFPDQLPTLSNPGLQTELTQVTYYVPETECESIEVYIDADGDGDYSEEWIVDSFYASDSSYCDVYDESWNWIGTTAPSFDSSVNQYYCDDDGDGHMDIWRPADGYLTEADTDVNFTPIANNGILIDEGGFDANGDGVIESYIDNSWVDIDGDGDGSYEEHHADLAYFSSTPTYNATYDVYFMDWDGDGVWDRTASVADIDADGDSDYLWEQELFSSSDTCWDGSMQLYDSVADVDYCDTDGDMTFDRLDHDGDVLEYNFTFQNPVVTEFKLKGSEPAGPDGDVLVQ